MSVHAQGGQQTITASGVLGVSAKPIRVFGYTVKSNGSGPGVTQLFDGTSNSGQERWNGTGTSGTGSIVQFGAFGKFFPVGCFVQIDANVSYVDIDYVQEN